MATLRNTAFSNATDRITVPSGTTAQRPSPTAGMLRFNTSMNILEFYDNGWRPVTGFSPGIVGSGGQQIYYRDGYTIHLFTNTGAQSFTPTFTGNVQVLVVAGGGSGGSHHGGGGGGGGVSFSRAFPVTNGSAVPLNVGAGAPRPGFPSRGNNGSASNFGPLSATGGGGGGSWDTDYGQPGGSGGGSGSSSSNRFRMDAGTGILNQGFPGGTGIRFNTSGDNNHASGGGGGAGGQGKPGPENRHDGYNSDGGPGVANDITGEILYWGGGGGAAHHHAQSGNAPTGGIGGGGGGMIYHGVPVQPGAQFFGQGGHMAINDGTAATGVNNAGEGGTNTGGGGGGVNYQYSGVGSAGGPGIVVVRY